MPVERPPCKNREDHARGSPKGLLNPHVQTALVTWNDTREEGGDARKSESRTERQERDRQREGKKRQKADGRNRQNSSELLCKGCWVRHPMHEGHGRQPRRQQHLAKP